MTSFATVDKSVPFSGQRDGVDFTARFVTFRGLAPDAAAQEPFALVFGDLTLSDTPALVRVHSGCKTGDLFNSSRCDCGQQLTDALKILRDRAGEGLPGAVIYMSHHEGRGIGLNSKIRAYDLMDKNPMMDTYAANRALGHDDDERDYTAAGQILNALGMTRLTLLTGNAVKLRGLESLGQTYGFSIDGYIPMARHITPGNARYLADKERLGGHVFTGRGLKIDH